MEIKRLPPFCVIAETHSLAKAANLLFITHSGLSKSMKLLQEELGFNRNPHPQPTKSNTTRLPHQTQKPTLPCIIQDASIFGVRPNRDVQRLNVTVRSDNNE